MYPAASIVPEQLDDGRLGGFANHTVGVLEQLHQGRDVGSELETVFLVHLELQLAYARCRQHQRATTGKPEAYLEQPLEAGLLCARVLPNHGGVSHGALDFDGCHLVEGDHGLEGQLTEFLLLVAQLLDNQGQGTGALLCQGLGVLTREAGEEVIESREAGVDEGGMLGAGGCAQGLEDGHDAGFGDILLLDARLDGGDLLDLGVDRGVGAQEGDEVGDLLVGNSFRHFPLQKEDADVDGVKTGMGLLCAGKWSGRESGQVVGGGRKGIKKTKQKLCDTAQQDAVATGSGQHAAGKVVGKRHSGGALTGWQGSF